MHEAPGAAAYNAAPAVHDRHSMLVRVTHGITVISVAALLVSGVAILLAHPRLYWGEAGAVGAPSLLDLPLPFVLVGQSGWGRSLHFLAAWALVLTGGVYLLAGLISGHFRARLLPSASDLLADSVARVARGDTSYGVVQRLVYLVVIFVLAPLMIWTGLAMSPAIAAVVPVLVTALGGQQSARTLHFVFASLLVLFVIVHVLMVWRAGFVDRVKGMVTGRGAMEQETV